MPQNLHLSTRKPLDVLFPIFDGFQVLDVCGPLQVFSTANDELELAGRPKLFKTRVCSTDAVVVRSSSGVLLQAERLPKRLGRTVHMVIVPGGPGVWDARNTSTLEAWIGRSHPKVMRLASVCTGAFILGRVGLLDGGRAVTHWAACERLAKEFPKTQVQSDAIFLREGSLWTSAGVTAGIDMALAMVEIDAGREIAVSTAKKLVVFYRRPGGQSQFSSALLEQAAGDPRIEKLNRWLTSNLRQKLDVATMAAELKMTPRTFARFIRLQTGTTPARMLEKLRLERACALIESGTQSAKSVAAACGFSSEEILRRIFIRHLKVSPSGYRERFSPQRAAHPRSASGHA